MWGRLEDVFVRSLMCGSSSAGHLYKSLTFLLTTRGLVNESQSDLKVIQIH